MKTSWKTGINLFKGEVKSIHRYLVKEVEEEANGQYRNARIPPKTILDDIYIMMTKGTTSRGLHKYLKDECCNSELLGKIENKIYHQLTLIEDRITEKILGSIE